MPSAPTGTVNNFALAIAVAADAHVDQKRKYTGEPYILHPIRVAEILRRSLAAEQIAADDADRILAAAVMHDVLEDTDVRVEDLLDHFDKRVVILVSEVTDVSSPSDGNRAARKALDRAHLAKASYWGAAIKLADLIDNTRTIARYDPKFAKTYLAEKAALLDALPKAPEGLTRRARGILSAAQQRLERMKGFEA